MTIPNLAPPKHLADQIRRFDQAEQLRHPAELQSLRRVRDCTTESLATTFGRYTRIGSAMKGGGVIVAKLDGWVAVRDLRREASGPTLAGAVVLTEKAGSRRWWVATPITADDWRWMYQGQG
jgi:hypothetical protein